MSKYKEGDKVLMEMVIDEVRNNDYAPIWVTLERDDRSDGMWLTAEQIDKYVSKTYADGLADAWELARKLYCDIKSHELKEIFDCKSNHYVDASIVFGWILNELTPQQALAKIEAYEKSQQIQVGDVVYAQGIKGVVIDECTEDSDDTCYVFCENGNIEDWKFVDLKKTGRHIDISNLLEQIRGDD